jgi:tetratricopeptide (TPR) repeat protein
MAASDKRFFGTIPWGSMKNLRFASRFGASSSRCTVNRHHETNVSFRLPVVLLVVLAGMLVGTPHSHAQGVPASPFPGNPSAPIATRSGASLHVTVLDENKKPLKQQALLRLTDQETGRILFQTTRGSEAIFTDLPANMYLLEVGAAGYLGRHMSFTITEVSLDRIETVILALDPAAVDLKLKDPGLIPSKARKEAGKGIQALELSNFVEARKHLEAANRQYPSSSSINFLLGYLALQQRDQDRELTYLTAATKLDPSNIQAQNLLGQLYYQRGNYAGAAEAEAIVVSSSSDSLIVRKILANSYLNLKQYDKARENAQWLVDKGGSEGASAQLVLGQALAGLQQYEAAIQALKAYLAAKPASPAVPQTRQLLAQLEKLVSQGGTGAKVDVGRGDPNLLAEDESSAGSAGMPADIDAVKPSVAAGVPCPANILALTANPSKSLVDSVAQFSAVEHMVHENISPDGTPRNRETRQFNYVVSLSETPQGGLTVDEYRDSDDLDMPGQIKTTGLAVLAIAFHPAFRDDFDMHCEGLGDWNGQAAWLVHFRQIDNRSSRLRTYVVNKNNYPVSLKGRAWIGADNLQIIHLETDLVRPVPEIHLLTEHTSVTYGPVQFKNGGTYLWLPKSAELYVHFGKRRFYRSANFDHFMLFATGAAEKVKVPNPAPSPGPNPNPGDVTRQ